MTLAIMKHSLLHQLVINTCNQNTTLKRVYTGQVRYRSQVLVT